MQTDVRSVRAPEESARAFVYRVLSTYINKPSGSTRHQENRPYA